MPAVFMLQSGLLMIVSLVLLVIEAWAFIDAVSRKPGVFEAADKLNKTGWLIILGLALVAHLLFWSPISFLNIIGTVAALVYLLDARPALRAVTRR